MIMKKTITLLSLVLVAFSLSAATYYVGADGGVTLNNVIAQKGYRNYDYSMGVGYKVSIPIVITFNDNLGLESGVSVYGKYYKYSQTVDAGGKKQANFDLNIRNGFLTFPVAFRLAFPISNFEIFTTLGGYLGAWVYGNRSGSVINGNDKSESVNEYTDLSLYNRFDAGVRSTVGAGVNFGQFLAYLQGEYDFSITDMNKRQKYGSYKIHNSTFLVTLGILWGINK